MVEDLLMGTLGAAVRRAALAEKALRVEGSKAANESLTDKTFQDSLKTLGIRFEPVELEVLELDSDKVKGRMRGTLVDGRVYDFDFWRIDAHAKTPASFPSVEHWHGAAYKLLRGYQVFVKQK